MIVVTSPLTGQVLGEVPCLEPGAVRSAVARARVAFGPWSEQGVRRRVAILERVLGALISAREDLIDRLIQETGKVRGDALTELLIFFDTARYYLSHAEDLLKDEVVTPHLLKHKRGVVSYTPRGVVGIISPWNFPVDLGLGEVFPALLAGNAVVLKPSELTPLINLELARLAEEAGLPGGVFQVLTGAGETGAAMVEEVDQVTFTGSVNVGRKVAAQAAQRLIPCTLELGGKDPMVVLRDADLDRASSAAVWGAFFNSGQMCMSVERVYVEAAVCEDFTRRVVAKTRALRQGVDGRYTHDVGAMTRPQQLDVVEAHLQDAVDAGARVLCGGGRPPGLPDSFFEPTVVADVDHTMTLMTEETFGPVLPIMAVSDAGEAVRLANDSVYGLNASVWSRDLTTARSVARSLQSGNVCVNDVVTSYGLVELPFGGEKDSGVGRRHGPGGLRKYAVTQAIAEDRLRLAREPNWYPYSPRLLGALERAAGLLGGIKSILRR
ncbi:MAG: succinic semialdehyde dehydrogenase [Myxococcota bacterium]